LGVELSWCFLDFERAFGAREKFKYLSILFDLELLRNHCLGTSVSANSY
jgi:hypothetical protein